MSDVDMATIQLKGAKQSFMLSSEKNFKTGSEAFMHKAKCRSATKTIK